ncbi:hypothetical protein ACWKWJ_16795 [Sphingopyxis terrae subsp. ummariensis]|jgi:hypothetical protein
MSENISLAAARLQRQVPAAEVRIDDAMIAVSNLLASVVTARRDTPGVPAVRGQATITRLVKVQSALAGASGDVLRVHGELVDIARETGGLDLHECPSLAEAGAGEAAATG